MMNDYLEHYAKGSEKPGHKYSGRKFQNGKWIYIYNIKNAVKKGKKAASTRDAQRKKPTPIKDVISRKKKLISRKKYDQKLSTISIRAVKTGYTWVVNKLSEAINNLKHK